MEIVKCNTAREFIDRLHSAGAEWFDQKRDQNYWIFRGCCDTEIELLPSIYRNHEYEKVFSALSNKWVGGVEDLASAIKNKIKNIAHDKGDEVYQERLFSIIQAAFVEIEMIEEFLCEANQIQLNVPTLKIFREQDERINSARYFYYNLDEFIKNFYLIDQDFSVLREKNPPSKLNSLPYAPFLKFDFPQAVALARHHGIMTRFLDWTWSPYIAAYFSAKKGSDKKISDEKICVWALNTEFLEDSCHKGAIELHKKLPQQGLEFLHKQRGLFTEMLGAEGYYFHEGQWPDLEKYLACSIENSCLKRIELPRQHATEVINILNSMNINEHHLMPTYDNVAKSVSKKFQ